MSDAKSLDKSITVAGDRKGFIALNSNKALIDTATSVGMTNEKMKNINDKDFISNMMKDLQNQGMSLKSFKNADKSWKTGAAFLSAIGASQARKQTMRESLVDDSGKTADVAVGTDGHANKMSIDGATVINDGRKVDTQNVTKKGATYDNQQQAQQKAIAFNQKQAVAGGKQVTYDQEKDQIMFPDAQTVKDFAHFTGDESLIKSTRDSAVNESLAAVADFLGASPTGVVIGTGGAVLGVGGIALGRQIGLSGNKSVINKTGDKTGNSNAQDIDSSHPNSFRDDIKNYTEEHMEEARECISP